jgi:LAO/AO transport system kinase
MENLSREPDAFIRPAPSGNTLGGVARKTRESVIACEAAGYDIIFVETIGVGQSEITVRSMVDFFLLLLLPGEGDELQGLKKGTVELADTIVVNKADGDNVKPAEITKRQYEQAIHYIRQATKGWQTVVTTSSALDGTGIGNIWKTILEFQERGKQTGIFYERRKEQQISWFRSLIKDNLLDIFYTDKQIRAELPELENKIKNNQIAVSKAANMLIQLFLRK